MMDGQKRRMVKSHEDAVAALDEVEERLRGADLSVESVRALRGIIEDVHEMALTCFELAVVRLEEAQASEE